MATKKNNRKNSNVNNSNNNAVTTVNRPTAKAVSSATAHNVVETIEMLVEDGFNYGSPNIKMIDCITIFENNDYVTERHFYVNGYKYRMDELMKYSMKRYLMSVIPQFSGKEDVDKLLTRSISYKAGSDAPQYLKDRMKQQTTLVRGLIKALKDSTDLNAELTAIFGNSKYDAIFMEKDVSEHRSYNWKAEYKKDYSGASYRL